MSYRLEVVGHKELTSADEVRAYELGIAEQARAFVASLEGVNSATGGFSLLGSVDLTQPAPAAEPVGGVLAHELATRARAFADELDGLAGADEATVRARADAFADELDVLTEKDEPTETTPPAPPAPVQ